MTSHWATYGAATDGEPALEDVDIRPAIASDCRGVAAIIHERDSVPIADARAHCERDLAGKDRLVLVATVGGELAGFARAARWERPRGRLPDNVAPSGWYLLGVIVRDRFRRHGLGRELTRSASSGSANEPTKRGTSRTRGTRPRSTCTRRLASSRSPATSRSPTHRSKAAKGSCSGWTWRRKIRPNQTPNQTPAPDPARGPGRRHSGSSSPPSSLRRIDSS